MNNLLRSLRFGSQINAPDSDLKALFSAVREVRSHDPKSVDPFYDALDGLLTELRMVTMDNRDAEAFLRPVSRSEYPDYFDIIAHPMDLQTMVKKVKTKSYKSKLEFSDDLNLIWDNCYRYNSTPDHPLRACANRLRDKANVLLARITDRAERQAPRVPQVLNGSLPSPPSSSEDNDDPTRRMVNGKVNKPNMNGKAIIKSKSKDRDRIPFPIKIPPILSTSRSSSSRPGFQSKASSQLPSARQSPRPQTPHAVPFEERAAILRTPDSMSMFMRFDQQLDSLLANTTVKSDSSSTEALGATTSTLCSNVTKALQSLVDAPVERESEQVAAGFLTGQSETFDVLHTPTTAGALPTPVASQAKRKRSDSPSIIDNTLRKKIKLEPTETVMRSATGTPPVTTATIDPLDAALDLWWKAVGTNGMLASGVPPLRQPSPVPDNSVPIKKEPGKGTAKRKRNEGSGPLQGTKKRRKKSVPKSKPEKPQTPKTLLSLMNSNITTLRSLRTSHIKYSQLTKDQEQREGVGGTDTADGSLFAAPPENTTQNMEEEVLAVSREEEAERARARERPWKVRGEVGKVEARECTQWMCSKVLEHTTFQGTSSLALEYLTDVAIAYISNVGETLRLICDDYNKDATPEEMILHTLFENGVPTVADLEMYIKDDIVRQGARLQDMDKKLGVALQELIQSETVDDDAVFGENADEDNFASGMFGELIGEDYLGLEASGILSEIGLGSLSIPKRLWKGKKDGDGAAGANVKKNEPKLPYPPPPPFILIRSNKIDDQIGLLQPYLRDRFAALAHPEGQVPLPIQPGPPGIAIPHIAVQPPPSTPTPSPLTSIPPTPSPSMLAPPMPYGPASLSSPSEILQLEDDAPQLARTKIGPLGQIIVPNANSSAVKKKPKNAEPKAPAAPKPPPAPSGGAGAKKSSQPKDKDKDKDPPPPKETTPSPKKKKAPANANATGGSAAGGGAGTKKAGGSKTVKGTAAKNNPSSAPALVPPV